MSDLTVITFQTQSSKLEILNNLKSRLPSFAWRGGDSDQQGPYISGKNSDSIKIKIWLNEFPYAASISFSNSWDGAPEKSKNAEQFLEDFKGVLREFSILG